MTPQLDTLDHLVLSVADIPSTVSFYTAVLGMTAAPFRTPDGIERMSLLFGCNKINLHPAEAPFEPKAKAPTPGSADLCFLSETPLTEWLAHLSGLGITVEDGPVSRTGATGPILSIYLRDPDQNLIEISNPA